MRTDIYKIEGMHCAACSAAVERVVSKLNGVTSCRVNLITEKMTVSYNDNILSFEDFEAAVKKAGFKILPGNQKPQATHSGNLALVIECICAGLILIFSMGQMLFKGMPVPRVVSITYNPIGYGIFCFTLCLPVLFLGRRFFIKGIPALLRGSPDMDTLVAIGSSASFIYSTVMLFTLGYNPQNVHNLYFESVATVIALVTLGKHFEAKSKRKTASAIEGLSSLTPSVAYKVVNGEAVKIPAGRLKIRDVVLVKTGGVIPADGVITEGSGYVDESMLTGESMPVLKNAEDKVTGGSILTEGILYIKITAVGTNSTLSKIVNYVEQAQNIKAPISRVADKAAGIFVPVVMIIAVLTGLIWVIFTQNIGFAIKCFTCVLVIACPCAMGLATPTAIMVGTGLGAKNGILIRNGEALEHTGKAGVVVFDKTGTLTLGEPSVIRYVGDDKLIGLAFSMEMGLVHPIARAICDYAKQRGISPAEDLENITTIAGYGVVAEYNGERVMIGNKALMERYGIVCDDHNAANDGCTMVYISLGNAMAGLFAVRDTIKSDAKAEIQRLKQMGIKPVLLSGDNENAVLAVAENIGIERYYFNVPPTEKAEVLTSLREQYGMVIMVGDGINDAPALASADIGCAMGAGSDIALSSADIILIKNDVESVARAIALSRKTLRIIKQNLFWAFGYNIVCIPIAAGVLYPIFGILLSPMVGGLCMSLSSVCVVSNALRLRSYKFRGKE